MPAISIRSVLADCLGRTGELSILEDAFGVYGDSTRVRSLQDQIGWIRFKPFVRLALVTIQGATPNLQDDLDNANLIYRTECGAWVYCVGSRTENRWWLLWLDQTDCNATGHVVSAEENELFGLGRNMGADIVGYYINGDGANAGCAAHPPGRRGFWVGQPVTPTTPGSSIWAMIHEMTHVVGNNPHAESDATVSPPTLDNLMTGWGTGNITNPPPDLSAGQCLRIRSDPGMTCCSC
jgi:hypothetical protein